MRLRRWAGVVLGLAFPVLAAGCADSDDPAPRSDAGGDAAGDVATNDAAGGSDTEAGSDAGGVDAVQQPGLPCAPEGKAAVAELQAGQGLQGPEALGRPGDWLLVNDVAAFVIQRPDAKPGDASTYYYYGGLPIDAAPLDRTAGSCQQAGPEVFGEMAFAVGKLEPASFGQSILRGFAGTSAEVLQDGKDGGPVVLRVWGVDEPFWLVEYELNRTVVAGGGSKPFSSPLGLKLAIDYTLRPGSPVLEMALRVWNQKTEPQEVLAGGVTFLGDATELQVAPLGTLSLGGFGLRTGLPWLAARGRDNGASWALASAAQNLSTVNLSGVDALIDLGQLGTPLALGAAGAADDNAVQEWRLAVSPGGSDRPVAALQATLPELQRLPLATVQGVLREPGGVPVPGAKIALLRTESATTRDELLGTTTDADGKFTLQVPITDGLHLHPRLAGWPVVPATKLEGLVPGGSKDLTLELPPPGRVAYDIQTKDGKHIPARLQFFVQGKQIRQVYTGKGIDEVLLPPGTYEVTVSRGYEFSVWEGQVTVTANTSTPLGVQLERLVQTQGWLSFDGHVHAAPSADSTVTMPDRIRAAAADGLEIIGHTDHEILYDPAKDRPASGVGEFSASVPGEELTATTPEHMSVWGLPPSGDNPRGNPVIWFAKDVQQLYDEVHARGALVALNHPRNNGCGYLCLIDWDRLQGKPTLTDPTVLGLPADATLWSWDMDAVELINGLGNIFALGKDKKSGIWDDWMSWLNYGHKITPVASTDVHGDDGVGSPRTYFVSPTDDPTEFAFEYLRSAIKAGQVTLSAGAFALASVGGAGPGSTVTATAGQNGPEVLLDLDVQGIPPIDVQRVSIFVNCDEVARLPATDPNGVQKLKTQYALAIAKDAHVVVAAFGTGPMPRGFDGADPLRTPRAVVAPIYIDADGDGVWTPPGGKTCSYSLDP